jgi:lysophospholipase L1-like esterase
MADWLGYGLDELYADEPSVGFERKIRASSGLIRYDAKNEALDWAQMTKDSLVNAKPNAIIVMLGLNDRGALRDKPPPQPAAKREPGQGGQSSQGTQAGQPAAPGQGQSSTAAANQPPGQAPQDKAAAPIDSEAPPQAAQNDTQRPVPGGSYDFHTEQWAALYAKRVDQMIAALKSAGAPVIWVGLPAIRGTKSTGEMSYLDELYRARAERAGIAYVDIWDGFVDDQGRYTLQGPDFEGQIRRLRSADGVHFTKAGAVKLASYVDRELRRAMSGQIAPVALPAPETAPNAATTGTRPDVGPVLPLSVGAAESGDLAGGGGRATQPLSDPTAVRVLTRGDPLPAASGRADDFSWPRPDLVTAGTPDVAPQPAALSPAAPAKKGDAKKPANDAATDSKNKSGKESPPRKSRAGSAGLDGAPVPPAPIGSR